MWEEPKVCKGHLEVLCDGIFSMHFTDDMGLVRFSVFHFADDMGVCVFRVRPTIPMSSAGAITCTKMQDYPRIHFHKPQIKSTCKFLHPDFGKKRLNPKVPLMYCLSLGAEICTLT